MEIYTELAKWVGWPAIVALLLLLGGIAGWILNQRIENLKEKNAHLEKEYSKFFKTVVSSNKSYLDIDYGIKIITPNDELLSNEWVDVTGKYSIMPPPDTLRLFTVHPEKTTYGERIWPQEIVKEFQSETNSWRAKVNIGGLPKDGGKVVAAIVGQPTIVLWNYYYKVAPEIGWWDIEGWPSDTKICDRVPVRKL